MLPLSASVYILSKYIIKPQKNQSQNYEHLKGTKNYGTQTLQDFSHVGGISELPHYHQGRSPNTVVEYRTDILMFFSFLKEKYNLSFVDANFIHSITLNDMYAFISDCQNNPRDHCIITMSTYYEVSSKLKFISSFFLPQKSVDKSLTKSILNKKSIHLLKELNSNNKCMLTFLGQQIIHIGHKLSHYERNSLTSCILNDLNITYSYLLQQQQQLQQ